MHAHRALFSAPQPTIGERKIFRKKVLAFRGNLTLS
jgi:hypothetical protein